jgi:(p)ppGpp synthase/HD superfamily hydrolase
MTFPMRQHLFNPTDRAGFEREIAAVFSKRNCRKIMQAYRLSKYGHRNQWRDSGERYFDHPKALALAAVRLGIRDASIIIALLLHDIREDSHILLRRDIVQWFGIRSDHYVEFVTKDKTDPHFTSEGYFARLAKDGPGISNTIAQVFGVHIGRFARWLLQDHPGSWVVKLIDRLHNLSTLYDNGTEHERFLRKKARQVEETRANILPLALKLSKVFGYEALGQYLYTQISALCDQREREVAAG